MAESRLMQAVDLYAGAALKVSESAMTNELSAGFANDDPSWGGYETLRESFYRVYQELRGLAVTIEHERAAAGLYITTAQRILAQHHAAYRDLWGALVGVGDGELDTESAPEEWPLRVVLAHMYAAELGFQRLIRHALERLRSPDLPLRPEYAELSDEEYLAPVQGNLAEIRRRFDALHASVISDFAALSDAEVDAPSRFWEGYDLPIRFRLHRFDAHLREHTIQVDKTMLGIGHAPNESERLLRLIYKALGEAEGAAFGAADVAGAARERVAAIIERQVGYLS